MKTVFSPRELARAIGVSESSMKRWVDDGRLTVIRTPGGHRRIPLHAVVQFVQDNDLALIEPRALGLAEVERATAGRSEEDDGEVLRDLLLAGDAEAARSFVLTAFIRGKSVAAICDGAMREAMTTIGSLWRDRADGIFLEHRATDIALDVLRSLRLGMRVEPDAPVAIGGAPEDDPYALPSLMAAIVLESAGFRSTNLGADTPIDTLLRAATDVGARLVWLCVSSASDPDRLGDQVKMLAEGLDRIGAALIVGGRDLERMAGIEESSALIVGESMVDLERFGRGFLERVAKEA